MDAAAVRDELALVGWDAWALERGLVLRALAPPPGGYALERDDGACVAWLEWRLRDRGRNVVARAQSRKGLERMRLAGDAQAGMTLPVLIAVIFAILLSDQAAAGLPGAAAGAPAGG